MLMTYTDFSFELVEEAEGHEDNTRRSAWRFRIGFPQTQQAYHALHRLAEDFQDFNGDLEEEFGTIDFYGMGATQVFGYQLHETTQDRIADYAEQCRGWFQSHGYTCGPVEACTLEEHDDPDAHHPHAAWFKQAWQLGWQYEECR